MNVTPKSPCKESRADKPVSRILIVDDCEADGALLERCLKKSYSPAAHITQAFSINSGYQQLSTFQPELICLDYNLPDGTAADFLKRAASEGIHLPPVLVITGLAPVSPCETIRLGAADFILKNMVTPETLPIILSLIFEKQALRSSLEAAKQIFDNKLQELDSVAKRLSHDLNGSLSHFSTVAQFLAEDTSPAMIKDCRDLLDSAVLRASTVIDGVSQLNGVGKMGALKQVALATVMDYALLRFKDDMAEGLVHVDIDCPQHLECCPKTLARAVENLVKNSVKFTKPIRTPKISITATTQEQGQLQIIVEDNGPGIAEDVCPYIFDSLKSFGKGHTKGLGIGLNVTQRIIDMHGGSIVVEASAAFKKGARFIITLPAFQSR